MVSKKEKKKTSKLINIAIFLAIAIIAYISLSGNGAAETNEEIAKCVGDKSTLYVQLGCTHCETQENILGENLEYITVVDCFYERSKCSDIKATPSWKINGDIHTGVKTFDQLKELAKC